MNKLKFSVRAPLELQALTFCQFGVGQFYFFYLHDELAGLCDWSGLLCVYI